MSSLQMVITITLSLASGIIGSALMVWFMVRIEERKQKIDTLRTLLGNRDELTGEGFCSVAKDVLVVLLKEAATAYNLSPSGIPDTAFLQVINRVQRG